LEIREVRWRLRSSTLALDRFDARTIPKADMPGVDSDVR
jgi:hypothetical protein